MLQIVSSSLSDQGRKRRNNEDYIASFEPEDPDELSTSGCLYIVADGVGGAIKGEKASRYATQKVLFEYYRHPELSPEERLRESMRQSGNDIFVYAQDNHDRRMATTMVAAAIRGDTLTIANVGDSRAYLIRDGNMQQITRDHSVAGEMVRDGLMSEEDLHNSRVKNLLTRSLGGEMDVHIDIFPEIPLHPNDRILLCSDGLSRYARREDLISFASQGSPEDAVKALIGFANQKGGADNISSILIEIGQSASGQESILRKRLSQSQSTPDWENIPTLIDAGAIPKKSLLNKNKRYITWGILAIALLLGFSGLVIWLINYPRTGNIPLTISLTKTSTSLDVIAGYTPSLTNTIPLNTVTPVVITTIQPIDTLTTTINKDTSVLTATDVTSSLPSTPLPPICIFQVSNAADYKVSPYLITMLPDIFHIEYHDNQTYFYFDCVGDIEYINCQPKHEITDPTGIQPEWWIVIPEVIDDCVADGGTLIQPP